MDEWMFSLPPPQLQHCLPVYLLLSRAHSQSSGGTQHHEPTSAPDHKLSGPAPPGGAGALFPGTEGRTQEPLWQGEAAFTVHPREWLYLSRLWHARGGRLIRISIIRPTLVLVSDRHWYNWLDTLVSVRPQCSVVANIPLFQHRIDTSVQTPLLSRLALHAAPPPAPLCSVVTAPRASAAWEQQSERHMFCWGLMRWPIMAGRTHNAVWSYCTLVNKMLPSPTWMYIRCFHK